MRDREVAVLRPGGHPGQGAAAVALDEFDGVPPVAVRRARPPRDAEGVPPGDEQHQVAEPEDAVGDHQRDVVDRFDGVEDRGDQQRDPGQRGEQDVERGDDDDGPPRDPAAPAEPAHHEEGQHDHDDDLDGGRIVGAGGSEWTGRGEKPRDDPDGGHDQQPGRGEQPPFPTAGLSGIPDAVRPGDPRRQRQGDRHGEEVLDVGQGAAVEQGDPGVADQQDPQAQTPGCAEGRGGGGDRGEGPCGRSDVEDRRDGRRPRRDVPESEEDPGGAENRDEVSGHEGADGAFRAEPEFGETGEQREAEEDRQVVERGDREERPGDGRPPAAGFEGGQAERDVGEPGAVLDRGPETAGGDAGDHERREEGECEGDAAEVCHVRPSVGAPASRSLTPSQRLRRKRVSARARRAAS
nr:hypothetical protein [Amycolatopsis thermoflava]